MSMVAIDEKLYFNLFKIKIPFTAKEILRFIVGKIFNNSETKFTQAAELSLNCISSGTGIDRGNVSKGLAFLKERGYIQIFKSETKGGGRTIKLNSDFIRGRE